MILRLICIEWTIVSSIGSILSGVFTILLFFVGKNQLKKIGNSSEFDVYFKLKNDFNSFESKVLLRCIIVDSFSIKNDVYNYPTLVDYTGNELSDELLNHIEDLCIIYDRGLLNLSTLIEGYGRIVKNVYENQTIIEYIRVKRLYFSTPSLHSGLEKLYNLIS